VCSSDLGSVGCVADTVLRSFAVRTGKTTKTFFVGTRVRGKYRRITVGSYPAMSLAEARKAAGSIINDAQAGIGPELRKKREKAGTFGAVALAFMQDYARTTALGTRCSARLMSISLNGMIARLATSRAPTSRSFFA